MRESETVGGGDLNRRRWIDGTVPRGQQVPRRKRNERKKRRINHGSQAWDPVGEIEPESRGWLAKKRNEG